MFDAVWGDDPVSHKGAASHIVASSVQPKPVQRPRPRTLLAAYTPAGLDRVARRAEGWNPAGVDVTQLAPMWQVVCERAVDYGRDPAALSLVVRANIVLHPEPLGDGRPSYWGSLEQVAEDLRGHGRRRCRGGDPPPLRGSGARRVARRLRAARRVDRAAAAPHALRCDTIQRRRARAQRRRTTCSI